jgi:hypothetical protein
MFGRALFYPFGDRKKMNPMKNYAPRSYRAPDCPDCTPRQHYADLRMKGVEDLTAREMSGFNEIDEARSVMKGVGFWLAVALVVALAFWLRPSSAADIAPTGDRSSIRNEAMFAACLSGMTVQVGDRLFHCLPAGRAK